MRVKKNSGIGKKLSRIGERSDLSPGKIGERIQSFLFSSLSLPLPEFGKGLVKFLKEISDSEVLLILKPSGLEPLIFHTEKFPKKLLKTGAVPVESPEFLAFFLDLGKGEKGTLIFKREKNRETSSPIEYFFPLVREKLEGVIGLKIKEEFFKREYSLQKTLSRLLRMTLEGTPIERIMDFALQYLVEIDSMPSSGRGSICLLSPDGRFECISRRGFSEEEERFCREARKEKKVFLKSHKNPETQKRDHLHLLVPIFFRREILGYINLILKEGAKPGMGGLKNVEEIARMIGAIIRHYSQEEREKFHSQILSQFKGGVIAQDKDGRISFLNPEASKILKESFGRSRILEFKNFLPQPLPEDGEIILKGKEGEKHFQSLTFPLKDIKFAEKVTFLQDITLRRISEEAQRKTQERFKVFFENTQEGIAFVASDGEIVFANQSAAKILGYENPEELKGKKTTDFYLDPEIRFVLLEEISRDGSVQGKEVLLKRKDGKVIPVLLSTVKIEGEDGAPHFGIIFSDISSRKEAEEKNKANLALYQKVLEETVNAFSLLAETRDPYLAGHQTRVTQLACAIAKELGFDEERMKGLRYASLLHDLGKLGVPLEILSKPGKLNEMEFNLIKIHPQISYSILKNIPFPWPVAEIAYQHHERLDGSGYPRGLKGDEILLEARILGVADVVEAMSSHRPYRPALGIEEALREIESKKGILYDPGVVETCLSLFKEKELKLA